MSTTDHVQRRETLRRRSASLAGRLARAEDPITRETVRGELVALHLPLVEHCARRFRHSGEPIEDLVQAGAIGLIKAVDRFETGRGVELAAYAVPTILGEIRRHLRDTGWAVKVPRSLQELGTGLATATAELTQRHGRAPTVPELAHATSTGVEQVLDALGSAAAHRTSSVDAGRGADRTPLLEREGAEDDAVARVLERETLRPLLERLPAREKQVLLLRFFADLTQSEIAEELGISQVHVSRLLTATLARLRAAVDQPPTALSPAPAARSWPGAPDRPGRPAPPRPAPR